MGKGEEGEREGGEGRKEGEEGRREERKTHLNPSGPPQ